MNVWAIDPGDKHVGLAQRAGGYLQVAEMTPDAFFVLMKQHLNDDPHNHWMRPHAVVIEQFKLHPTQAKFYTFKEMLTSEMIGAVELFASMLKARFIKQPSGKMKIARATPYYEEMKVQVKPRGEHMKSALGHLCYFEKMGG